MKLRSSTVLVAAALTVATLSCLSGRMIPQDPVEQPVPTAKGPPPTLSDDPSAKIDQLQDDLVTRRLALSLPKPPAAADDPCEPVCTIETPPDKPSQTPGCSAGSGSACVATCAQADGVCDDAAQICALAKELRTEAWAAGRCRDARVTCLAAQAPCCECK